MTTQWHESPGQRTIEPSKLKVPKAIEFHDAVVSHPYARFLQSRRSDDLEVVVFEIDIEVPQWPVCDIHHAERLAAIFTSQDNSFPEVVSLRTDFPSIPHL